MEQELDAVAKLGERGMQSKALQMGEEKGAAMAHAYLAGVDGSLWVASAEVVALDGPSVPQGALAEPGMDEADLGLLQG